MPRSKSIMIRRAFTIVELMVVLSIISLLVSLTLPAIGKARQSALAADCGAKVDQLTDALTAYTDAYKGRLPHAWSHDFDFKRFNDTTDPWHGYGGYTWAMATFEYVGRNLEAHRCKAYANPVHPKNPELGILNGQEYLIFSQYRINPYTGGHGYGWGVAPNGVGPTNIDPVKGKNMMRQRRPSQQVAIFDADRTWNPYVPSPACAQKHYIGGDRAETSSYNPWWTRPQIGVWHFRGSNISFLDNHVEWLPLESEKNFLDFTDTYWRLD